MLCDNVNRTRPVRSKFAKTSAQFEFAGFSFNCWQNRW
jgi:hypothetical protein